MKNSIIRWCEAHGYKTKVRGNKIYWLTGYQTVEFDTKEEKTRYLSKDFFQKV